MTSVVDEETPVELFAGTKELTVGGVVSAGGPPPPACVVADDVAEIPE
jgi:hypothetical protein